MASENTKCVSFKIIFENLKNVYLSLTKEYNYGTN